MKTLKILIKLGQRNLDGLLIEKKSKLSELENIENSLKFMLSEAEKEQKKYTATEYSNFLESYLKEVSRKKIYYENNIETLNNEIALIDEKIREAFAEVKRFEIIEANKKRKEHQKQLKQETKELDEINILNKAL